jgi:glutamyl-tRNA reductase
MKLYALAIRHTNTPVHIREKFILDASNSENINFIQKYSIVILSTCNRSEVYIHTDINIDIILNWWANSCNSTIAELKKYITVYIDKNAINHIFEVASGIDSMVLGETQINKQIKDAYSYAAKYANISAYMHNIFQNAFACAKYIRTHTDIGKYSVSFASAGFNLLEKIFADMNMQNMLFIGAGKMMRTLIPHFTARGYKQVTIANRSIENVNNLIKSKLSHNNNNNNIKAISLNELQQNSKYINEADVIVACLDLNYILIDASSIKSALIKRKYKSMYLLDLSVPLVIDKNIKRIDDVYLYDVDDLSNITNVNKNSRIQASENSKSIINLYIQKHYDWYTNYLDKNLIIATQQTFKLYSPAKLHEWIVKIKHMNTQEKKLLAQLMSDINRANDNTK